MILKQCALNRMDIPKFIQDAPELHMGLELYYTAFWDLDGCRQVGFSVGQIPWVAIHEYATYNEFDDDQKDTLFRYIRGMDKEYLSYHSSKK